MSVTTSTSSSISDITDECFFAEVKVGDNGDTSGVPGYDVGTEADQAVGFVTWDADLSDGFDTQQVNVELDVTAGGGTDGVAWSVTGGSADPLNFSGVTYGSIQSVKIRAAVQAPDMQMTWSQVVLTFIKGTTTEETITLTSAQLPQVSTIGESGPIAAEFIATITPPNLGGTTT